MDFNRVNLDIDGAVATICLNHPEVLNAIGWRTGVRSARRCWASCMSSTTR